MKAKHYLHYTQLVFTVVFIGHGLRVLQKWDLTVNGAPVPMWVSLLAVVLTGYFAFNAHKLMH